MDEKTKARMVTSQVRLRAVNEAIVGRLASGRLVYRCECGRVGCNRLIELTPAEYEALRADPRRFAVVPDHEVADIERVVERHGHYAVVQAHAEVAPIAERTDARRLDG